MAVTETPDARILRQKALTLTGNDRSWQARCVGFQLPCRGPPNSPAMRDLDPFTGIVVAATACLAFWAIVLLGYWFSSSL